MSFQITEMADVIATLWFELAFSVQLPQHLLEKLGRLIQLRVGQLFIVKWTSWRLRNPLSNAFAAKVVLVGTLNGIIEHFVANRAQKVLDRLLVNELFYFDAHGGGLVVNLVQQNRERSVGNVTVNRWAERVRSK